MIDAAFQGRIPLSRHLSILLPNNYLYTDDTARAISVDARGILEALDDIYNASRLVTELTGE